MQVAENTHHKKPKAEGVFTALSLISLIQCISNNKKMCIDLYSVNGSEGRLYFDNARVVDALINNSHHGVKAFFRMMKWEKARFQAFEVPRIAPEHYRISEDVSYLLMEGLRQKRETEKIQKQLQSFYKITRDHDLLELSNQEKKIIKMVPEGGIFINALVDKVDMTDWEAYSLIQSLIIKKALSLMKIKVLVVTDSEITGMIVRDILEHQFDGIMAVKLVESGREAMALIDSDDRKKRPDLVFTETIMDEADDRDLIAVSRKRTPPIHVIVITSLQREMRDILDLGANYLNKEWLTRDNVGDVMMDLVERTLNGEIQVIGGEREELYNRVSNA